MKKITGLIVMLIAAGLILSGCEGCQKEKAPEGEVVIEETVETISPKGAAVPADISSSLSKALCKRMIACTKTGPEEEAMSEEDCVTQTTTSLNEAQNEMPLNITGDQLSTCVASIEKGSCEEVLGPEPPAGCEFLK